MPNPLTDLDWTARFVDAFPGDPETRNFTRRVRDVLYSPVAPTPVSGPRLLGWSDRLAADLGIARPEDVASLDVLAGNRVLPAMRPYAARYGGHQFGNWAGQLGDGRAITLGEAVFPNVGRLEFQLKGAGPTPYSRRADGRAVLRSSLREFLCSESMHFLGVPTTRALSLVTTGDTVVRDMFYDGRPEAEPGAIVCRVAPSFVRFGHFEILASHDERDLLKRLADFLIADHYPELDAKDPDVYGQFLDALARRTAGMIVGWQRVGFVHGVMNTDNLSAIGVTIDYGPYGFLEPFDPGWTPNTTDAYEARYRFANQPAIALWNLERLGASLRSLVAVPKRIAQSLELYQHTFQVAYEQMLAEKMGLPTLATDEDRVLVEDLYELMRKSEADYTNFFRRLSEWAAAPRAESLLSTVESSFYGEARPAVRAEWDAWAARYSQRLAREPIAAADRAAAMKRVNPKFVPRNYLAQNAITAATAGDAGPLERLMRVMETPYDEHPGDDDLAANRPAWAANTPGCSALSCSS